MKLYGNHRVPLVFQVIATVMFILLAIMIFIPNYEVRTVANGYDPWGLQDRTYHENFTCFFGYRNWNTAPVILAIVFMMTAIILGTFAIWFNRPIVTLLSVSVCTIYYLIASFGKYGNSKSDYWFVNASTISGGTVALKVWISEILPPFYIGWVLIGALLVTMTVVMIDRKHPLLNSDTLERGKH